MRRTGKFGWSIVTVIALAFLPAAAMAQAGDDEPGGDDALDGGDSMDFTDGDGGSLDFSLEEAETALPGTGLKVTGLVLRAEPDVDLALTEHLTETLITEMESVGGYQVEAPGALRERFAQLGEQGTLDCVYNPICLSRIGEELGLARLVIGRLTGTSGDYTLSIDLINVEEGTVEDYTNRTVKGGKSELDETVGTSVRRLFDVRVVPKRAAEAPPAEAGPIQTALAWTTLGVGVIAIGAGVFFGLDASSIQGELEDGDRTVANGRNVYSITQVEAEARLKDAEDSALLANIFYGVGIAAGVTAALLFFINPGSDIATEEELAKDGPRNFRLIPILTDTSAGVGAGFSF
jgi:hypothetical protein